MLPVRRGWKPEREPRREAEEIVQPTVGPNDEEGAFRRHRAETGVVIGHLLGGIDGSVGTAAGGAIKFLDIAAPFVRAQTADLAGTV
jgi:hypothetical protein